MTLSRPETLRMYLQEKRWPFPVVADPERAAYRQFGLARTRWTTFFRPDVVAGYMKFIFRGWRPRAAIAGEDLLQLGGDFVLDADQRIVFAYSSAEPTDRPAAAELIKQLTGLQRH